MLSTILNSKSFLFLKDLFKWALLSLLVGLLTGAASALFLFLLKEATTFRSQNSWLIGFLPIGGLVIGLVYHYFGKSVVNGNNQILEEYHAANKIIPLKMAPFVMLGTIITHLFGGSAGREGTAVQMGASISDQFSRFFGIDSIDRKVLLVLGVSGGFASVFGTPLAGCIFALEVLVIGRMRYEAILPSVLVAVIADLTCTMLGISHTAYSISVVPAISLLNVLFTVFAGMLFGLTARLFAKSSQFFGNAFQKYIKYAPLRPFVGGIIITLLVFSLNLYDYIGLGIPMIENSFVESMNSYDFIIKLLLTTFTLGAGFKGGEVTPLFFIGAALGNVLMWFLPLPMALLAGMGFVAVFSGATNTPIACSIMGIELFGAEPASFLAIACITAYIFSGHSGIYGSQIIGSPKMKDFLFLKSISLKERMTKGQQRENQS